MQGNGNSDAFASDGTKCGDKRSAFAAGHRNKSQRQYANFLVRFTMSLLARLESRERHGCHDSRPLTKPLKQKKPSSDGHRIETGNDKVDHALGGAW